MACFRVKRRSEGNVLDPTIPESLQMLLLSFNGCFTQPGFINFVALVTGWIACPGRHSISRVIQAASGVAGEKHHSAFYRFLSAGSWVPDSVGRVVFTLLLPSLPSEITAIVDDTLSHKSGPHIFGANMHFDAAKSTYGRGTSADRKAFFAFGHNWVVLSLWIPLPWNRQRGLAIPVLFRLYRSKKGCPERQYRKRTKLAADLLGLLASWVPPDRQFDIVGDTEYACKTLVKHLPSDQHFTGPMSMDAALYAQPGEYQGRGRKRLKGKRLLSPKAFAKSKSTPWEKLELNIYGREVTILVKSQVCMWYTVAGTREVRMVVTRDPAGRIDDRAYFSTNPQKSVAEILAHPADRRPSLRACHHGSNRGWAKGDRGRPGRLSGERAIVERASPGAEEERTEDRPRARDWRRSSWILDRSAEGIPPDETAALLGP